QFQPGKVYRYSYDAFSISGLPEPGVNRAGLSGEMKIEIHGHTHNQATLKITQVNLKYFLGPWPSDSFYPLTGGYDHFIQQLEVPVRFDYSAGRIGDIYAPPQVTDTAVNIVRGILNLFQLSLKKNQQTFELQETGVEGICQTTYVVQEGYRTNEMAVVKTKDLNNCDHKVYKTMGTAYAERCPTCQKMNKNLRSTAVYNYAIFDEPSGYIIKSAHSEEIQQLSVFDIKEGNVVIESRQKLILEGIQSAPAASQAASLQNRGGLMYKFPSSAITKMSSLFVTKGKNLESEIHTVLKHLVENNQLSVHEDAPAKFLRLTAFLRNVDAGVLQSIWHKLHQQKDYRRWILDAVPAMATSEALLFLKRTLASEQLTSAEATQIVASTLSNQQATRESLSYARELLNTSFIRNRPILRKTAVLGYGSLVFRYCANTVSCPDELLQPLHDLLSQSSDRAKEEEIVLALKALGNAGQPNSIKKIQRFLPGQGKSLDEYSTRVQAEAIMALRNIAKRDPRKVQEIVLPIFLNVAIKSELRIRSCIVFFESKPSVALVSMVAVRLRREPNLQVASFVYSQMRSLSRSSNPEFRDVAAACSVAIKMLGSKLDRLGCRYSKAVHVDTFNARTMAGVSADYFRINSPSGPLPRAVAAKIRGQGMGYASDIVEFGLRAEGLQELLYRGSQEQDAYGTALDRQTLLRSGQARSHVSSIHDTLRKLSDWKSVPEERPLASGYVKVHGQEVVFAELDKKMMQRISQLWHSARSHHAAAQEQIGAVVSKLEQGMDVLLTKGYVVSEVRYMQPVCIGIPMDLNLLVSGVTTNRANLSASFSSLPADMKLADLLATNIELRVAATTSMSQHAVAIMGLTTDLAKAGMQTHYKTSAGLGVNGKIEMNARESNFKASLKPFQQKTVVVLSTMESIVFVRDPSGSRILPVLPPKMTLDKGLISQQQQQPHHQQQPHQHGQDQARAAYQRPWASHEFSPAEQKQIHDIMTARPVMRRKQSCSKSAALSSKVCFSARLRNAAFIRNALLYKITGDYVSKVYVQPTSSKAQITKVELELQAG
uniref:LIPOVITELLIN (LV-1N, LV-1C) n=1 Tax=Ichthyomyzon unicuspis TaxID=30308 RepID=UPI0012FE7F31